MTKEYPTEINLPRTFPEPSSNDSAQDVIARVEQVMEHMLRIHPPSEWAMLRRYRRFVRRALYGARGDGHGGNVEWRNGSYHARILVGLRRPRIPLIRDNGQPLDDRDRDLPEAQKMAAELAAAFLKAPKLPTVIVPVRGKSRAKFGARSVPRKSPPGAPKSPEPGTEWVNVRSTELPWKQLVSAAEMGEIGISRVGSKLLMKRAELVRWIQARAITAPSEAKKRTSQASPARTVVVSMTRKIG